MKQKNKITMYYLLIQRFNIYILSIARHPQSSSFSNIVSERSITSEQTNKNTTTTAYHYRHRYPSKTRQARLISPVVFHTSFVDQ